MAGFLLITTGGTIDAKPYHGEPPEYIEPLGYSLVPDVLTLLGIEEFHHIAMEPKDSKEIAEEQQEIEILMQTIADTRCCNILITCGTDRMVAIANQLYQRIRQRNIEKRIIVTGSMIPLANTKDLLGAYDKKRSDGFANLKRAVKKFGKKKLEYGVYMSVNNGKFFEGNEKLQNIEKVYDTESPENRFFRFVK